MGEVNAGGRARPLVGAHGPYGKTMRPVGSEYEGKDGYIMVKVAEWPSKPGSKDNWVLKHRHVWEQANGREVPRGCVVMFKDRDARNFDPSNLECVRRGVMQRMNRIASEHPGMEWRDAETFDAVRAIAEIDIESRRRELERPRPCAVCGRMFVPDTFKSKGSHLQKNKRTCRACLDAGRCARG